MRPRTTPCDMGLLVRDLVARRAFDSTSAIGVGELVPEFLTGTVRNTIARLNWDEDGCGANSIIRVDSPFPGAEIIWLDPLWDGEEGEPESGLTPITAALILMARAGVTLDQPADQLPCGGEDRVAARRLSILAGGIIRDHSHAAVAVPIFDDLWPLRCDTGAVMTSSGPQSLATVDS